MELKTLSQSDCEQVRIWRNKQLQILRTSFPLTKEMQEEFYLNVICDRNSNARFWGMWKTTKLLQIANADPKAAALIGMCGLENISPENRNAEISILLKPPVTDDMLLDALKSVLDMGFKSLNLENIYTEVYLSNTNLYFWIKAYEDLTGVVNDRTNFVNGILKISKDRYPVLPARKFWNGRYYESIYLNFNREDYINENTATQR